MRAWEAIGGSSFEDAFDSYAAVVRALWKQQEARDVCEIGGGRSPLFTPAEVAELGARYSILDISASELERAPEDFDRILSDVAAPSVGSSHREAFDFMFSRMVAEHVKDGLMMHLNVFQMLRPGGVAFHFFPTLYHPAFVANRVLPTQLSQRAVLAIHRQRRADSKFPAYYSHCFGPTKRMHRFLRAVGYEVLLFRGFYGTSYLRKVPLFSKAEDAFSRFTAKHQVVHFGSFAYLVVRRPA